MKLQTISDAIQKDRTDYLAIIDSNRSHLDSGTQALSDQLAHQLHTDTDYLQAHLVAIGYDLCGGTDIDAIIPIARSIQVVHASAQLLAEGQGVASAHALHVAMAQLANVNAPEPLRIKALSITHRSMMLHAQGLATSNDRSDHAIYCFATKHILNPLHVGMVFTGVGCPETDAITPFAMTWGKAISTKSKKEFNTALEMLDQLDFWPQQTLHNLRRFYVAQQ